MKKNNTNTIHKLQQIQNIIRYANIQPTSNQHVTFQWGIHQHCRYGVSCPELNSHNRTANMIATELEPYLITIANNTDNTKTYMDVLLNCRGEFPSVYRTMEQLHMKAKKEES